LKSEERKYDSFHVLPAMVSPSYQTYQAIGLGP
jgi:hypothetical protein